MKAFLCVTLFGVTIAAGATLAFAPQPPILFERWEQPPVGANGGAASGVDFGLSPADIYQKYAAQMLIGLPITAKAHQQKNKRLIDIEIRSQGNGLAHYVYDVVWVRNEGSFLLESWLVTGLKADEVKLFEHFKDVIIVDIERYPQGLEWRFSVIVQRNSGKFDWQVLLDVTLETATQAAQGSGVRVVDVDRHFDCAGVRSPTSACPVKLDVVLVQNTGTNVVQTLDLLQGPGPVAGHQLTDLEITGGNLELTNWMTPGNPYVIIPSQSQNDVIDNHTQRGRVIDLEVLEELTGRPGFGTTITYWTVNLTNQ